MGAEPELTIGNVNVWDERCALSVHRKSKRVWTALGEYRGARIEVRGLGRNSVLAAWRAAARDASRF